MPFLSQALPMHQTGTTSFFAHVAVDHVPYASHFFLGVQFVRLGMDVCYCLQIFRKLNASKINRCTHHWLLLHDGRASGKMIRRWSITGLVAKLIHRSEVICNFVHCNSYQSVFFRRKTFGGFKLKPSFQRFLDTRPQHPSYCATFLSSSSSSSSG